MKRAAGFTRVMELVGGLGLEFGGTREKKNQKTKDKERCSRAFNVGELTTVVCLEA